MKGARTLRFPLAILFAVGLLCLLPLPAESHSLLERSTPKRDAVLRLPPREVTVSFSQRFDPRFSGVQVFNGSGRLVAESLRGPGDRRRTTIRVALPQLIQDVYTVRWRVHSAIDGHTTRGSFKFSVRTRRSDASLKGLVKSGSGARPIAPAKPGALTGPPTADARKAIEPSLVRLPDTVLRRLRVGPWRAPAPNSPQQIPPQEQKGFLDDPERVDAFSEIIQVAIRWESLVAVFLLAGAAIFQAIIFAPLSNRLNAEDQWVLVEGAGRLHRLIIGGACATLLLLAAETALLAKDLMLSARAVLNPGHLVELLLGTKPGWSILIRASAAALLLLPGAAIGQALKGAALTLLVVIIGAMKIHGMPLGAVPTWLRSSWLLPTFIVLGGAAISAAIAPAGAVLHRGRPMPGPFVAGMLLVAGLIPTSHAMGSGATAMLADAAHIFAGAVWVGGFVSLLIVLQASPPTLRPAVSRALVQAFSPLAGMSLVLLVVTGIYMMAIYAPRPDELTASPYGRTLLVKLALIAPLIGLGAVNRFRHVPNVAAPTEQAPVRRFLRLARFDVVLAVIVLGIASVLVLRPPLEAEAPTIPAVPPVAVLQTGVNEAFGLTRRAGDLDVHLKILPEPDGRNHLEAVLTDRLGRPISGNTILTARPVGSSRVFTLPSMRRGEGHYRFAAGISGAEEKWEIQVVVRRTGRPDVRATFIVSPLRREQ